MGSTIAPTSAAIPLAHLRRQLDNAVQCQRDADMRVVDLRRRLQLACEHEQVLETPAIEGILTTSPEFRVCECCGFAERGWGCGYQILDGGHVRHVSRHEAQAAQIGPVWPNPLFISAGKRTAPTTPREAYEMAVCGTLPRG